MRARVVEIPAHLDWSEQSERMQTRKVSLRVSNTSKLLVFASFLFRPLLFFVIPGLLLLVVAAWTLGSVAITVGKEFFDASGSIDSRLYTAFANTYADRPQSFIVRGFAVVVAVQLISLGLLATQSKRYFEELYHLGTSTRRRVDRIETSLIVAGVDPVERSMVAAPGLDEPVTLEAPTPMESEPPPEPEPAPERVEPPSRVSSA